MIRDADKLKRRFAHGARLLDFAEAALANLKPAQLVRQALRVHGKKLMVGQRQYRLDQYQRIFVVGAGKATAGMAEAVVQLLGRHLTGGVITVPVAKKKRLGPIHVNRGSHPFPDRATVAATRSLYHYVKGATKNDLVLCLISGGGSSLMALPRPGVQLKEKNNLTRQLMHAGAEIDEINIVRKHLSQIKGGQLAAETPATVISLVISDVAGDRLDVIASGPTVADTSTVNDALRVLDKYHLGSRRIRAAVRVAETPKRLDARRVFTTVIGNNQMALRTVAACAKRRGIQPLILTSFLRGEAKEVAQVLTSVAREIETYHRPIAPPALILAGGETTVTVLNKGHGGRNQELVLAAVPFLSKRMSLLSLATDGVDGFTPTPVAGAMADGHVAEHCVVRGINYHDYLYSNNSFHCLRQIGCLLHTGPTGTNVGDIVMLLVR